MLALACLSWDGCDTSVEEGHGREGSATDEDMTFAVVDYKFMIARYANFDTLKNYWS